MAKTITKITKIDNLTIAQNGLIVKYLKKPIRQIPFSEVDKIYIKVYKLKPIYGYVLLLVPMLLAFLCFEYVKLNIELSLVLLPVIPSIVKWNHFKTYGLVLLLKDGSVFTKRCLRG
jgi:hypothetical protein